MEDDNNSQVKVKRIPLPSIYSTTYRIIPIQTKLSHPVNNNFNKLYDDDLYEMKSPSPGSFDSPSSKDSLQDEIQNNCDDDYILPSTSDLPPTTDSSKTSFRPNSL